MLKTLYFIEPENSGEYRKYRKDLCGNRDKTSFNRAAWIQIK